MNRSKYWDIVKGIGIFFVVLGHAGCPSLQFAYIFNYFHLAIFFYCSGALYNDKHSSHPVNYFFEKLKKIYLPLMKYVMAFIFLNNLFIILKIYSVTNADGITAKAWLSISEIISMMLSALLTSNYSVELAGAMWMCFPLIISIVLFSMIRKISLYFPKIEVMLTVGLSLAFGIVGMIFIRGGIYLTWRSEIAFLTVPIVCAGFYCKTIKFNIILLVGSCFILFFSRYHFGLEISYAASIISNYLLFFPATFSGIYVVLCFARLFEKNKYFGKVFSKMGEKSFHIMALHFLCFRIVNMVDIWINKKDKMEIAKFPTSNYQWWWLYVITGVLIPMLLVKYGDYISKKIQIILSQRIEPKSVEPLN